MMSGFWLIGQPSNVLPRIMIHHLHVPSRMTSTAFQISSIMLFFAFLGHGLLSQMIGRRRAILVGSTAALAGGTLLYYATIAHGLSGGAPVGTAVLAGAFNVLALAPWGVATVYICERFLTHVGASGYGMGYSLAVVIPSFSGLYLLWLGHVMPYVLTPIVLVVIAAVLMIVGALLGPEPRQAELHLPDLGLGRAGSPPGAVPHST